MCRSSKGGVQWEIIFYSSFIGYTFTKVAKYCAIYMYIY